MYMPSPNPCMYVCSERTATCHTICKKYIDWKAFEAERIAKYTKAKTLNQNVIAYQIDMRIRAHKRLNHNNKIYTGGHRSAINKS